MHAEDFTVFCGIFVMPMYCNMKTTVTTPMPILEVQNNLVKQRQASSFAISVHQPVV